jgi:hypothetical protein
MDLVGRLARTGLRRGLTEGSRGWLLVGCTLTAVQLLRRLLAEPDERAAFELEEDETIEVSVVSPR